MHTVKRRVNTAKLSISSSLYHRLFTDALDSACGGMARGAGWGPSVREAAGGEGEGGGLVHGMEGRPTIRYRHGR